MTEIQLGPIVLSSVRFSALVALAVLVIAAQLAARRQPQPRLADWAWNTVFIIVIAARLGFVLENLTTYRSDPLSILYIWQGGFSPAWGLAAALVYSFITRVGRAALPPAVISLLAWGAATLLTTEQPSEALALPDQTVHTLSGEPVSLTSQLGQPLVINLWEPWCLPCRRELPMLAEADRAYEDVTFAFVTQTSGTREVQSFLQEHAIEAPNVWHSQQSQLGRHFRSYGLPTTLFFSSDGTLQYRHIGEISRAELDRRLAGLAVD